MTPANVATLVSEECALLQQHKRLGDKLLALKRIAELQLKADSARAWEIILEQKQQLLNQIEELDVDKLFKQTVGLLSAKSGNADKNIETIGRKQEKNVALLKEVMQIEADAEVHLKKQLEHVRSTISRNEKTKKVNTAYNNRSTNKPPRFLDSRR